MRTLDWITKHGFPQRGVGYTTAGAGVACIAWYCADQVLSPALFRYPAQPVAALWLLAVGGVLALAGFLIFSLAPAAPVVVVQTRYGWFIRMSHRRLGPFPDLFAAARALESPILSESLVSPRT